MGNIFEIKFAQEAPEEPMAAEFADESRCRAASLVAVRLAT